MQFVSSFYDLAAMADANFYMERIWIPNKDPETGASSLTGVGSHPHTRSDTSILKTCKTEMY